MRKERLSMLDIKNQSAKKSMGKVTKSRYTKATPSVTLEGSIGGRVSKRRLQANMDGERKEKRVSQEGVADTTMGEVANKDQ